MTVLICAAIALLIIATLLVTYYTNKENRERDDVNIYIIWSLALIIYYFAIRIIYYLIMQP